MKHPLGWSCATCDYFNAYDFESDIIDGECRRACPSMDSKGYWPRVTGDQWCGEFRNQAAEVLEAEQLHILVTHDGVGAEH